MADKPYDNHQLARSANFEEIAYLLQRGHPPTRGELAGMAGWTAHVMEQHADSRLIRPDSEYVGERGVTWTPLDRR
jgi:citrate synthase